jgi:hypothetical protein
MSASSTKTAAIAAAVLVLGLTSCGGDEGDEQGASPQQGAGAPNGQQAQQGAQSFEGGGDSGGSQNPDHEAQEPKNDTSADFTPRQHSDSGSGSEQFVIPGGDNSVQEFGAEAEEGEFEQAATALHTFYDARAQRAWAAACAELSAGLVASLEGRSSPDAEPRMSCAKGLALSTNPETRELQREEAQIDVASLRAEGDQGFLLYRDAEGTVYAIGVQREGGEWKLTSLAGLPMS